MARFSLHGDSKMPEISFTVNPFPTSAAVPEIAVEPPSVASSAPAPEPPLTKHQRAHVDQAVFEAMAAVAAPQLPRSTSAASADIEQMRMHADVSDTVMLLCTFALGAIAASLIHQVLLGKLSFA